MSWENWNEPLGIMLNTDPFSLLLKFNALYAYIAVIVSFVGIYLCIRQLFRGDRGAKKGLDEAGTEKDIRKKGKKRILVVDDEKAISELLKMTLEETGKFEVSTCNDSTKAVEWVKKLHPDLILLDIMMPKVSGTEIAMKLSNSYDTQNIPIVFLTALVSEEDVEKSNGIIGEHQFIAKPVKASELIDIINRLTSP